MKKIELQSKTIKELTALAFKHGVKRPSRLKEDLITEILMALKISSGKSKLTEPKSKSEILKSDTIASKARALATSISKIRKAGSDRRKATSTSKKEVAKASKKPSKKNPEPESPPIVEHTLEHRFETPAHEVQQPPISMSSPFDNLGELPEAYGTGKLFLSARDPYWLYCYWDFTWQQLEGFRSRANHGQLKVRIHQGHDGNAPIQQEIILDPGAHNWYIHVNQPNTDFTATFGYYESSGQFVVVSTSNRTKTPSDKLSDRTDARFVTIPFHLTFRELYELVKAYFQDEEELADVLHRLQRAGFKFPFDYSGAELDPDALSEFFDTDLVRRIRMGSDEITEWMRRRLQEETSSGMFSMTSPMGSSFGAPREFWMKVNAEVIVYGATDPRARLMLDGQEIKLKPDGTFRVHFSLPDGVYGVSITAESPDRKETRSADLGLERNTYIEGDVGEVPHPPHLKPPTRVRTGKFHTNHGGFAE